MAKKTLHGKKCQRRRTGFPDLRKTILFQRKFQRHGTGLPSYRKIWSFQQYKSQFMPPNRCRSLTERVRIFIWSLVQKIQQYHVIRKCPKEIVSRTIVVSSNVAHIVGEKLEYSSDCAMQNYTDLHKFLKKKLFAGCQRLPYRMIHFLNLLVGDPLNHVHFIAWHIAILSTSYQSAFIANTMRVPNTVNDDIRERIYGAIKQVVVEERWERVFLRNNVLTEMFTSKKKRRREYDTICPNTRSISLIHFHRDCVLHVGIDERTPIKYGYWLDANGITGDRRKKFKQTIERNFKYGVAKPNITLQQLLRSLFRHFPKFMTEVQSAIEEQGLLKTVSVSPFEKCRC